MFFKSAHPCKHFQLIYQVGWLIDWLLIGCLTGLWILIDPEKNYPYWVPSLLGTHQMFWIADGTLWIVRKQTAELQTGCLAFGRRQEAAETETLKSTDTGSQQRLWQRTGALVPNHNC